MDPEEKDQNLDPNDPMIGPVEPALEPESAPASEAPPAPTAAPEPTQEPEQSPALATDEPTSVPEPSASTEPSEAEKLAADNARLREELNKQARLYGQAPPVEPPPTAVPPVAAPTPAPATPIEFVTAEEAAQLLDAPQDVLNALLNKVHQAGREQAMREMPILVRQQTLSEIALQAKVQKFWGDNADLEPYKDFCKMVASQIEIENPSLGFDEVLVKTGEVARERLNLLKGAASSPEPPTPASEPSPSPALPSGPRAARRPVPQELPAGSQEKEMSDILNF